MTNLAATPCSQAVNGPGFVTAGRALTTSFRSKLMPNGGTIKVMINGTMKEGGTLVIYVVRTAPRLVACLGRTSPPVATSHVADGQQAPG